jgi:hypothetical protein
MRSPRREREWHSGELETAMMLSVRPDLVRRAVARRLRPVWVDFRAALARGARSFRDMAPGTGGYFGWPAVARAETGRSVMALRARLIADELVRGLRRPGARPRPRAGGRGTTTRRGPARHRARGPGRAT